MNDTLQKLNNMICMEEDHGCMLSYAYIDPEMAEDDDTLFKLHLSAVAAADRLDNTIRNA